MGSLQELTEKRTRSFLRLQYAPRTQLETVIGGQHLIETSIAHEEQPGGGRHRQPDVQKIECFQTGHEKVQRPLVFLCQKFGNLARIVRFHFGESSRANRWVLAASLGFPRAANGTLYIVGWGIHGTESVRRLISAHLVPRQIPTAIPLSVPSVALERPVVIIYSNENVRKTL